MFGLICVDLLPASTDYSQLSTISFFKLINMGRLIQVPSMGCSLKDIFKERVPGADKFLVSAELIAYLKWLIYVAAFKDRATLQNEVFYRRELAMFKGSEH